MIDSMDIYRSIREVLGNNFEIKVQDKDRKNPHPPCFYIKIIGDNDRQTAVDYETTDYSYAVIYFSNEDSLEDLSIVKEKLKTIFKKPLKVTAYEDSEDVNYVEVSNLTTTINEDDYILTVTLTIEHIQSLGVERFESNNNELMGDINLNLDIYN